MPGPQGEEEAEGEEEGEAAAEEGSAWWTLPATSSDAL